MLINTTADKQMYRNLIEESKSKGEKNLKTQPWAEEVPHSTASGTDSDGVTGQELLEQLLVTVGAKQ